MQETDYTSPGTLLRVAIHQTDYTKTEKSPPETIGVHQGADYTENKQGFLWDPELDKNQTSIIAIWL